MKQKIYALNILSIVNFTEFLSFQNFNVEIYQGLCQLKLAILQTFCTELTFPGRMTALEVSKYFFAYVCPESKILSKCCYNINNLKQDRVLCKTF